MHELMDRYRLALTLIPDGDAAGDLFMASRSEADLRRRAARWRAQHGLPPMDKPLTLPKLDADQREHALHLARRGVIQRRVKSWLIAAAAIITVIAGGLKLHEALLPRLDSHPAFAEEPVTTVRGPGELRLSVYQVVVTERRSQENTSVIEISIWWSVTGEAAADAYQTFRPQLEMTILPESGPKARTEWLNTTTTRRYTNDPDRVLGVSYFEAHVFDYDSDVRFRLRGGRPGEADFSAALRLPPPVR